MLTLEQRFRQFGRQARSGQFGRSTYALCLAHAVYQSMCCGYNRITAIELGVASGHGLQDLNCAITVLQNEFMVAIDLVGFDTGTGLTDIVDYKDHHEIWKKGDFSALNHAVIPDCAKLILGDVAHTIPDYVKSFAGIIGFVAIDLDLYSSTRAALPLFEMSSQHYLPAMPVYVDDVNTQITYNPWCGEALALREFNDTHDLRKFERKSSIWKIQNFHVFHVLDHAIRNGTVEPVHSLSIAPF